MVIGICAHCTRAAACSNGFGSFDSCCANTHFMQVSLCSAIDHTETTACQPPSDLRHG